MVRLKNWWTKTNQMVHFKKWMNVRIPQWLRISHSADKLQKCTDIRIMSSGGKTWQVQDSTISDNCECFLNHHHGSVGLKWQLTPRHLSSWVGHWCQWTVAAQLIVTPDRERNNNGEKSSTCSSTGCSQRQGSVSGRVCVCVCACIRSHHAASCGPELYTDTSLK